MWNWFYQNWGTIAVTLVLAAGIALIIRKLIQDKKQGKSSCGCNCSHCAMAGHCHIPSDQAKMQ